MVRQIKKKYNMEHEVCKKMTIKIYHYYFELFILLIIKGENKIT